jgi:signal transduction histidine kinase
MWQHLRLWLENLPLTDPIARRQASLLQVMLLGLLALSLVTLPIPISTPGSDTFWRLTLLASLVVIGATVIALIVLRRGWLGYATTTVCTGLILAIAIDLVLVGIGGAGGIILALTLPVTLAGLVVGRRVMLLVAGACVLLISVVATLEQMTPPLAGLIPPPGFSLNARVTTMIPVMGLVCLILDRFSHTFRAALIELEHTNTRLRAELVERRQLEVQLVQAQKMEGIGQLAGGIAHDFNNILVAISGYTHLAREALPPDHTAHTDLFEVQKAAGRAVNLTRQLLAFARRQITDPQPINLNTLLDDMKLMLRRLVREDIELTVRPAPDLWTTLADPGQMEQVLINLVVNARDAMPDGGQLVIETANVVLDEEYAHRHVAVTSGLYVLLAVSDTGVGIDQETLQHVFEPFFTTKQPGEGTGLGLSTCYGIVKQNGGNIWIYSEVGQGTTVKVYLPRTAGAAVAPHEYAEPEAVLGGSETVLLVEDEAAVRELIVRTLRAYGYQVLEADNGEAALRIAALYRDTRIHLLLTDVVMPHMGGRALADRIVQSRPALKVLFTSGYTDNAIVHHGRLDRGINFLPKPFTPLALVRKVREVLDS